MDKQRLQRLAGIVTEGSDEKIDADKQRLQQLAGIKPEKLVEYAQAFGQDGNDGTGGGAAVGGESEEQAAAEVEYEEEMQYEDEEGRAAFENALQVIAKEIVKAVPKTPPGQEVEPAEIVDELMKGRWREMLKDEIMDILEPGPSHNPDGMSRTEPHITF